MNEKERPTPEEALPEEREAWEQLGKDIREVTREVHEAAQGRVRAEEHREQQEAAGAVKHELDDEVQRGERFEFLGTPMRIRTETLREGERPLRTVEFAPEDEAELIDDVPIVVSPGFQQTAEKYRAFLLHLAKRGRRVIVVETPYGIDENDTNEEEGFNGEDFPIETRKARAILSVLAEKQIGTCDFFGQSEGAFNGVLAATNAPEQFRSVFLSSPPGLGGKDGRGRLLMRNMGEMVRGWKDNLRKDKGKYDERIGRRLGRDAYPYNVREEDNDASPAHGTDSSFRTSLLDKQTLQAVKEMAETDLRPWLRDLKARGVPVVVVAGIEDKLFTMPGYQRQLTGEDVKGFVSIAGGHYNPQQNPERLAAGVVGMIESIKAAQQKKEGGE